MYSYIIPLMHGNFDWESGFVVKYERSHPAPV